MRIDEAYRQAPTATDASAARPAGAERPAGSPGGASPAAGPPVTVTVSDKARALSAQTSEASDAKVASLQKAISEGTFKVDPQAIAKKIVDGS